MRQSLASNHGRQRAARVFADRANPSDTPVGDAPTDALTGTTDARTDALTDAPTDARTGVTPTGTTDAPATARSVRHAAARRMAGRRCAPRPPGAAHVRQTLPDRGHAPA